MYRCYLIPGGLAALVLGACGGGGFAPPVPSQAPVSVNVQEVPVNLAPPAVERAAPASLDAFVRTQFLSAASGTDMAATMEDAPSLEFAAEFVDDLDEATIAALLEEIR